MSPLEQLRADQFNDPASYAGQPVCRCCGSGWPCCADITPDGAKYLHEETCARYQWADYICGRCSLQFALRNDDLCVDGFSGASA